MPTTTRQAFTGTIFQWLAAAGVNVGILGKDQNGRVATDPIPAGVTFAKIQLVGAAYDPTLWSATYVEYSGANPAYGVGVSPPATHPILLQPGRHRDLGVRRSARHDNDPASVPGW